MSSFILTMVGLYSDDAGSAPASIKMSSTILLLASRAVRRCNDRHQPAMP